MYHGSHFQNHACGFPWSSLNENVNVIVRGNEGSEGSICGRAKMRRRWWIGGQGKIGRETTDPTGQWEGGKYSKKAANFLG